MCVTYTDSIMYITYIEFYLKIYLSYTSIYGYHIYEDIFLYACTIEKLTLYNQFFYPDFFISYIVI